MLLGSIKIEVALDVIRAFSVHPPQEHHAKETYNRALKLVDSVINPEFEGMKERLSQIVDIIEAVDNRCSAADGDVTPTLEEMTQEEMSRIYALAGGIVESDEDDEEDDDD